jgi:uncharacterized membrane protein YcjF (UPF0283 family)
MVERQNEEYVPNEYERHLYEEEKIDRFLKFERIFFRIQLGLLVFGIGLYALFLTVVELLAYLAEYWILLFMGIMIIAVVNGLTALIRIFVYLFKIRKYQGKKSVWRSVLTFILSPPIVIIFYILLIAATFTGCAVGSY